MKYSNKTQMIDEDVRELAEKFGYDYEKKGKKISSFSNIIRAVMTDYIYLTARNEQLEEHNETLMARLGVENSEPWADEVA